MNEKHCAALLFRVRTVCLQRVFALLALVSLSGCAYMKPYVPLDPTNPPSDGHMPKVSGAIAKIDGWMKSAGNLRDSTSTSQRTLNLMTFGFGFAAGASSIYGAHRDTVTGLGLAAGASYTGGALFVPADQTMLYSTAIRALVCIRTKATSLLATVESTERRRTNDLRGDYIREQLKPSGCTPQNRLKAVVENAERAHTKAIAALDGARMADHSAANLAESAALNVVTALNDELGKRTASAEAVLAAAKSAVGMAAAIGGLPAPSALPETKALLPERVEACTASSAEEIQAIEARYQAIEAMVNSALNALATLDTACVFNAPAVPAFSVSQEQITLATDASYIVTVSGGRPPYSAQWVNAGPTGVSFQLVGPGSIILSAGASAVSGGEYTLDVADSSLIPSRKSIKVKIK